MHNILVRDRVLATMEDGVGIKTRFWPKIFKAFSIVRPWIGFLIAMRWASWKSFKG